MHLQVNVLLIISSFVGKFISNVTLYYNKPVILQLALAELYEDEVKCKSSKSDRRDATVFKSPRTPPQR